MNTYCVNKRGFQFLSFLFLPLSFSFFLFFLSLSPTTLNSAPGFLFFLFFLGSRRDMKQRFSVDREKMEKGNRGELERVVGEIGQTWRVLESWQTGGDHQSAVCGAGYQRREILLFLVTNMSAMTSRVNQQFRNIRSLLGAPAQVDCCIMAIVNFLCMAFSESCSLLLLS